MFAESTVTIRRIVRHYGLLVFLLIAAGLCMSRSSFAQAAAGTSAPSSFTSNLINIEAAVNETFRYTANLHNGSQDTRIYDLYAKMPDGWLIAFRTLGSQVSSISVEAGKTQDISIEVNASQLAKPGRYDIPVMAISSKDTLRLNLQAVVKGAYGINLSTPTGLLSDDITEGSKREIHLVVRNTGTIPLKEISLSAQTPSKWEASFEPSKIPQIDPGKTADITATLTVPGKTIAGDYVTVFTAKNSNASSDATFRMTVKTSMLSGWIGIIVILLAIYLVYGLIRKYGRR